MQLNWNSMGGPICLVNSRCNFYFPSTASLFEFSSLKGRGIYAIAKEMRRARRRHAEVVKYLSHVDLPT